MKILELTPEPSIRINDSWVLYLNRNESNSKLIYKTHNGLALTISNDSDVQHVFDMVRNIDRMLEYAGGEALANVRKALGL